MKTIAHRFPSIAADAFPLCAAGCSTILVRIQPEPGAPAYPATNRHTVEVLKTPPASPHTKLGEITLKPSAPHGDEQEIEAKLQREAAKMGANAVIIHSDSWQIIKPVGGQRFESAKNKGGEARVIVAEAVRYAPSTLNINGN